MQKENNKKVRNNDSENEYNKSFKFNGTIYEVIDIAIQNMRWNSFQMIIEDTDAEAALYAKYWIQLRLAAQKERMLN